MNREDGRKSDQLRSITFEPDYLENPHGSVVITQGRTKVLCTAMVDEDIRAFYTQPWVMVDSVIVT